MIEHSYKHTLRWMKIIVEEAKTVRLETLSKKKIQDGKRKVVDDVRVETSKKRRDLTKTLR